MTPAPPFPPIPRTLSDYRDRLYREIAKRKSVAKELQAKEEAATGSGGGGSAAPAAARGGVVSTPARSVPGK